MGASFNLPIFLKIAIINMGWLRFADSRITCYECSVTPPPNHWNKTSRLCSQFDASEHYEVECDFSTFCMKKTYQLSLQDGKSVKVEERGCAPQKYNYQVYKDGNWKTENVIEEEFYKEGCSGEQDRTNLRTPSTEYCYCSSNYCNGSERTKESASFHHTDTLAVIFVFNIIKFTRTEAQLRAQFV